MTHDPTFVAIIERNLQYFTSEFAAANGNARQLLQSERENIFDAVKYAARFPNTNYAAARLLLDLSHLIEQNDSPSQWSQILIRVINRYSNRDHQLLCKLYGGLGRLNWQIGYFEKSIKIYSKSLSIATEHDDALAIVGARYGIGLNYFRLANMTEAKKNIDLADERLMSIVDTSEPTIRIRGHLCNLSASIALYAKRLDEAEVGFDRAIEYMSMLSTEHDLRGILVNKAVLLFNQGHYDRAVELTKTMVEQFEDANEWLSGCDAKIALGNMLIWRKQWSAALEAYNLVSVHELRKRGHHRRCAYLHNNLGNAYYYLEEWQSAKSHLEEAVSIHRDYDPSPDLASALALLAASNAALGLRKQAKTAILETEELLCNVEKTSFTEGIAKDLEEAKLRLTRPYKPKYH